MSDITIDKDSPLILNGPWILEPGTNRTLTLRGVNLSGGAKLPNGIPSHEPRKFWDDYDRKVSFVGRPFPLEEADEHLDRLKQWGLTFLRFVFTWEGIEHEGPGIYDHDYINFIIAVLHKCKDRGIRVFLDPHQDVWSRQSGGSGHPGWTHVLAGLNPQNYGETNAALVQNTYPTPDDFPKMIWPTNYFKLAAATLFTLFYAGATFAPLCVVNGVNIQEYLQEHFLAAVSELARRVHKEIGLEDAVVVGYDTMNEPGSGYTGFEDLNVFSEQQDLKKGLTPTPYQSMLLGAGIATTVENWDMSWRGPVRIGSVKVEPSCTAWLSEEERDKADEVFGWTRAESWKVGCIWGLHGVYSIDENEGKLLQPDYFRKDPVTGRLVTAPEFWLAYVEKHINAVRKHHSNAIIFVQPPVNEAPPQMPSSFKRIIYAPHWYDGLTLAQKEWKSWNLDYLGLKRGKYGNGPTKYIRALRFGEKAIRQCFVDQLQLVKEEGAQRVGNCPCIIGELGIPYDLKQSSNGFFFFLFRASHIPIHSEDSPQSHAMDANLNALEKNLLNFTLWNYVPDNDAFWGDQWNGEDLSIYQKPADIPRSVNGMPTFSYTSHIASRESLVDERAVLEFPMKRSYSSKSIEKGYESEADSSSSILGFYYNSAAAQRPSRLGDELVPLSANSSTSGLASIATGSTLVNQEEMVITKKTGFSTLPSTPETNARDLPPLHRPYAEKTAGIPVSVDFVLRPTPRFEYSFDSPSATITVKGKTEIYLPKWHFPLHTDELRLNANGKINAENNVTTHVKMNLATKVEISDGEWEILRDEEGYWVLGWDVKGPEESGGQQRHRIVVEGVAKIKVKKERRHLRCEIL